MERIANLEQKIEKLEKKLDYIFHKDKQPYVWTRKERDLHGITHTSLRNSIEKLEGEESVNQNIREGVQKVYIPEDDRHLRAVENQSLADSKPEEQKLIEEFIEDIREIVRTLGYDYFITSQIRYKWKARLKD